MQAPKNIPPLSKAILSATLTGIIAAVLNIIYNIVFRSITQFLSSEIFRIFSITIATILTLIVAGVGFFFLVRNAAKRSRIFTFLLIALTILCIIVIVLSGNETMLSANEGLLIGFIFISGLLAAFLIPYFYHHPRMYI